MICCPPFPPPLSFPGADVAILALIPTCLPGGNDLQPPPVAGQSPVTREQLGVAGVVSVVDVEKHGGPTVILLVLGLGDGLDA